MIRLASTRHPLSRVFWMHYVLGCAVLWVASVALFNALAPGAALDGLYTLWPAAPVSLRAALLIASALAHATLFSVVYVQLWQARTRWPLARAGALIIATGHGLALAVMLARTWPLMALFSP